MKVINGNNIDLLKQYPDNYFDAVVTDAPYGLGKEPNAEELMKDWIEKGYHEISGSGFMQKKWDAFVPQPVFWKEVFRVLKYGGHILSFYGSRTYDWGVMAMRFAGFEVRDTITWHYGCLSDDTEILTKNGYIQYHKFIKLPKFEQEQIMIYDIENDIYKWETPERWNNYNIHKDTCYRIKTDNTNQIVSRNHRCLVEREGKLVFIKAEELSEMEYMPTLSDDSIRNEQRTQDLRTWKSYSTTLATITPFQYSGIIFCPTVSTGAFVARRNGKIFLTGNSGFPKSHNISKSIDKKGGNNHLTNDIGLALKQAREKRGLSKKEADKLFCNNSTNWMWYEGRLDGQRIPSSEIFDKICEQWNELKPFADLVKQSEREIIGQSKNKSGIKINDKNHYTIGGTKAVNYDITAPSTDAAKKWDGWGTALKPASEPIVLARKPLEKGLSIAENVLKWGTGGINIDGCRVATDDKTQRKNKGVEWGFRKDEYYENREDELFGSVQGRFPANLILTHHPDCELKGLKKVKGMIDKPTNRTETGNTWDEKNSGLRKNMPKNSGGFADENGEETIEHWECVENCPIRIMDEQSGILKSGGGIKNPSKNNPYGSERTFNVSKTHGNESSYNSDSGGASRFFYCAKASKSERNNGLNGERWFYDLELVFNKFSFTEQNLFIWEQEELNQNMDLNGEAQLKKDISEGIVLLAKDNECSTTSFGKENTVLFPKAIKFTTSTRTKQTIELKTLNYYQHLNINDCIADVIKTNKENGLNLAENVGMKNLLKLIFIKEKTGFPRGVKIVAKKTPQLISVKDVWQKSNIHSTVKPVKLMQYLVRMVTPPNGIVLDPFCGSGTTGIACKLEGFEFVGIEQDAEYCKIAEARIQNYQEEPEEPLKFIEEESKPKVIQQSLF
jgi:DNA modification methylase